MPDRRPTGDVVAERATAATRLSGDTQEQQGIMAWLGNLTLRSKLLLMLLPIGLISMGVQGILGHFSGTKAMLDQGIENAIAIRQSKKQQLEAFFNTLRDGMPTLSEDLAVVSAMTQFRDSFAQLGRQRIPDERRKALETYYKSSVIPGVNKAAPPDAQVLYETIWPRTDRAVEAQLLFIAENPFKAGERAKLADHPISNPYTLAHFTYHQRFREIATRMRLYDMLLVDADSGNVVYSVEKEIDFGTSLFEGPFANTTVGRVFRRVIAEHKKGYVATSDFEDYLPSGLTPQMFMATPVYANFRLTGVLIGQVSVEALNKAVNGDNSWKQDGLGESGIIYVVGPDRKMRSDHRRFIEDRDRFILDIKGTGLPEAAVGPLRTSNTTILRVTAPIEAVDRALRGETGTMVGRTLLGKRGVQAYAPLRIPDLNWAIVTQKDEAEVLESVARFQRSMMVLACALALGTALLSLLLATRFLRPVNRLMEGLDALKAGKTDTKIEATSTDEFGQLTGHFNDLASQVRDRDAQIAKKTETNGELLKRLFPPTIVERMVKGETQIVDLVPNVTVIYASVVGFVKETEAKTAVESMTLLNELFDLMDAQAAEHGVDRVKTFGENYIAACGMTEPRLDHAQRAVAFCDALARELARFCNQKGLRLELRAALASGDVNAGLVGDRRFVFEIWGRPLNYARRLIHEAPTGEVRITDTTQALLGNASTFKERPLIEGRTLGPIRSFGRKVGEPPIKLSLDQAAE